MQTSVLLLRGVNVGGHNRLPVKSLRDILVELGAEDVATYIQSGNAVFHHPEFHAETLATDIRRAINRAHGFEPATLVMSDQDLGLAIDANPFPHATIDPATLHLFFLSGPPAREQLASLHALAGSSESFEVLGTYLYLHAPHGIARSKLVRSIDSKLAAPVTARNWRTVSKLLHISRHIRDERRKSGRQPC
jgi:uncharacterized protein (DUF1697 family)